LAKQFGKRFQVTGILDHNELAALIERDSFSLPIRGQSLIAEAGNFAFKLSGEW
jgi:hypothetical protein